MAPPLQKKADLKSEMALKANQRLVKGGDIVVKEGDRSNEVFLLMSGSVVVLKGDQEIAVIEEPMSYFGEMAALVGEPRSATIRAKTDCKFVIIPGDKLESIIDVSPLVGKKMLRTLAARLAEANKSWIASKNQITLLKQKFSQEYNVAIKDYKRLIQVIGLVYNDTKYPVVQELLTFSQGNSILAKMGIKTELTTDHVANFKLLTKALNGTPTA